MEKLFYTVDVIKRHEAAEPRKVDMNPPRVDVNYEVVTETKQEFVYSTKYVPAHYEQRREHRVVRKEKDVDNGPRKYEDVYDGIIYTENHKIAVYLSRSSPSEVKKYFEQNFPVGEEIKIMSLLWNYQMITDKKEYLNLEKWKIALHIQV